MTLAVSESFILASIGALGGLITILFSSIRQSRCNEINCLCFKCKRQLLSQAEIELEKHQETTNRTLRGNSV